MKLNWSEYHSEDKCKSWKPNRVISFHFFNLLIFISFEMFTIHAFKIFCEEWNRYIFLSDLNQGVNVGVGRLTYLLCFSLIYFSDIYINAKYNNHINFDLCPVPLGFAMPPTKRVFLRHTFLYISIRKHRSHHLFN